MASRVENLTMKVTAEGLDNLVKESAKFKNNMEGATKASNQTKAYKAARQESEDYGVTRSLRPGGTGATARDFAQEAQGLGGLVRLYATYAANIFAVSAAFSALSNAMDTTNMVRGLDQLGAASGTALGSLSKRLVVATDGAISLREAMEATAKASSSGMSSENILRMGKVAKQASQALGVDMADAVSRITRGITKLEPELLDELGIFTKVDKATQDYAKSVGKSANALTDFERRMAFANAVLAEGEQKFNAINIDTNPYTKLLASVKNVAQTSLEFVNKGLAPIVKYLSESPGALLGILTAIGVVLAKQALPAIGQFKAGLENAAEQARETAVKKAKDAADARLKLDADTLRRVEAMADSKVAAVDAAEKKIRAIQKETFSEGTRAQKILAKNIVDVTPEEIDKLEKTANNRAKKNAALKAAELEVVKVLREHKAAEEELVTAKLKAEQQIAKEARSWGTYGQTVKAAQEAQQKAVKNTIISNAAYNGSLIGIRGSIAIMNKEIADSGVKMGMLSKGMLVARGSIAAVGGALATLGGFLSGALMWFGLIASVVGILDGAFSKASKEIGVFEEAVKTTKSATENLTRTMESVWANNPFSVQSLNAQATAMLELSNSMDSLAVSAAKALAKINASGWDRFKEGLFSIFGGGVQNEFTEQLAASLSKSVQDLENSPIATSVKSQLQALLKIENVSSVKDLEKALQGLDPKSEIVARIRDLMRDAAINTGIAASKAKEFEDSFKKAGEQFQALENQYKVSDNLIKFSEDSVTALLKLRTALSGPITNSIANLQDLVNNLGKRPIFGLEISRNILGFKQDITEANDAMVKAAKQVQELEKALASLKEKGPEIKTEASPDGMGVSYSQDIEGYNKAQSELRTSIAKARAEQAAATAKAEQAAALVRENISKGLSVNIDNVAKSINAALAKGSTQLLQGIYSRIDNVPELAGRQFDLKIQELASEAELIKVQQSLAQATIELKAAVELDMASRALEAVKNDDPVARRGAQAEYNAAKQAFDLVKKAAKDPIGALKELNGEIDNGNKSLEKYAQTVINSSAQTAGFKSSLQGIGQQMQLIKLIEKPLAEAQARNKQESELLKIRSDSLGKEQQALTNKIALGQLGEQQAVSEKESIARKIEEVRYLTEASQIQAEYTNSIIVANGLAKAGKEEDAKKLLAAASTLAQQKQQVALQGTLTNQTAIEVSSLNEKRVITEKILASTQRMRDLSLELVNLDARRAEAVTDMAMADLDRASQAGTIGETEYLNAKRTLEIEKERKSLINKLQNEEAAHRTKIENLITKKGQEQSDEAKARAQLEIDAEERNYKVRIGNEEFLTDLRISGIEKAIQFEKDKYARALSDAITDTIVTALTKGGREGAKVLRNFIVEEMRRKITIQVNAQITQSQVGRAAGAATDFTSTVLGGFNSYNLGGSLTDALGNAASFLMKEGYEDLSFAVTDLNGSLAEYSSEISAAGAYFSSFMTALEGDFGAAIGEAAGYYFGNMILPGIGGAIGATFGKILGSALGLTDDSGTYHTGGAGSYSSTQGRMTGTSVEQALNFNLAGQNTVDAENAAGGIAEALVKMFDEVALTFGKEAGYYAATAFADDTSKDGAWGALMVKLGDQVLVDWKSGSDKWPGREFADGAEGQKQYLDALAADTVEVLKGMDLPAWANDILGAIGGSPTMEKLQTALAQINLLNTVFETFSGALGWTRESIESLIGPLGGVQAASQKLGFYYENFYTAQEKLAYSTSELKDKFTDLGVEMPDTREGFRALVEAAEAAGDEALVASLIALAPAFKEVKMSVEDAASEIADLAGSIGASADNLASIITDGMMNNVDGREIGKMLANTIERGIYQALISQTANAIAGMVYEQIISPILASIVQGGAVSAAVSVATMNTVVSAAKEMISALIAVFNDPAFQALLAELSSSFSKLNFGGVRVPSAYQYTDPNAAQDAADKAKEQAMDAVDSAYKALEKAVNAQKKILQEQLKVAEESLRTLENLISVLDSSITDLRNSVDATAALSAAQGRQFIEDALTSAVTTGALPDSELLSKAIAAVKAEIDDGNYESKFQQDRAKLVLAGQLDAIKSLAIDQKTDAELQLEALNAQILSLDNILVTAQAQVDAIKGVDTSVKTVTQAINDLNAAIASYNQVKNGGSTTGSTSRPSSGGGFVTGPGGGQGVTYATEDERIAAEIAKFEAAGKPYHVTRTPNGIIVSAASSWDNQNRFYGVGDPRTTATGKATNPFVAGPGPAYATGGIFDNDIVTRPTMFDPSLMAEAGPEAIMPLTRTKDGSLGVVATGNSNSDQAAQIAELRNSNEMMQRQLAHLMTKIAKSTEETRKLLDEVVRGGEAITVQSEIATY